VSHRRDKEAHTILLPLAASTVAGLLAFVYMCLASPAYDLAPPNVLMIAAEQDNNLAGGGRHAPLPIGGTLAIGDREARLVMGCGAGGGVLWDSV
jgi:hypothetical protein